MTKPKRAVNRLPQTIDPEDLCEANKLLVKRMESNPDEFHLNKGGKWADYLNMVYARVIEGDERVLVMLPLVECQYVWGKYTEVAKSNLHKNFMQRILRDQQAEEQPVAFSTTGRFSPPTR